MLPWKTQLFMLPSVAYTTSLCLTNAIWLHVNRSPRAGSTTLIAFYPHRILLAHWKL